MKHNDFKGFEEFKVDKYLKDKTKAKMAESLLKKQPLFKIKRVAFAAIPVVLSLAVLSFVFYNAAFSDQYITSVKAQDLMAGISARNVNVSNALSDNFINSTQNFSLNLFKETSKNKQNTLVSPASAFLALGMTANGADSSTLDEFKTVLGKYGLSMDDLNKGYKAYSDDVLQNRINTQIELSNSIWYRTGFKAKKSFLQKNADFFGATARTLDFNDDKSIDIINDWVKSHTKNRIDKLVGEELKKTQMALINALAFDAKWETPFDKNDNAEEGTFLLDNGKNVKTVYMKLSEKEKVVINDNETAVLLPYDDGRFAFLCILPKEGVKLEQYVNNMTDKTISHLVKNASAADVKISFPRFSVSSENELNQPLMNMGLKAAFDPNQANFSKMGEDNELYISKVRQKTFLRVNEKGTEAGAATVVEMTECCAMDRTYQLDFNRPFVYAVVDTKTGLPMFIGRMDDVSKAEVK